MSTRLTNDLRETIAHEMLQHRFTEHIDALIAERSKLAGAVYDDLYRKSDRERMAALPKGWLPEEHNIGVQFGAESHTYQNIEFSGVFYGALGGLRTAKDDERVFRRVLHKHRSGCAKAYDPSHKLATRYQELAGLQSDMEAEFKAAKRQTLAALNSVQTIKRLIEMWPEAIPFASKYENSPRQLPTVPTETLNALLGLPVAA